MWYPVQVAAQPLRGWRGGYGGMPALEANQTVTIEEGSGVVRKAPIGAKR